MADHPRGPHYNRVECPSYNTSFESSKVDNLCVTFPPLKTAFSLAFKPMASQKENLNYNFTVFCSLSKLTEDINHRLSWAQKENTHQNGIKMIPHLCGK